MAKGEPTSRDWPYDQPGVLFPKPWTERQIVSAKKRGVEWWQRVLIHRGHFDVFVAPRGVILPCGCNTTHLSEEERRVVRHRRAGKDPVLFHDCPHLAY